MTAAAPHIPVLLDEVIAGLAPLSGEVHVDATFGAGGYSRAILSRGADLVAIDRDPSAIAAGAGLVAESHGRLRLVPGITASETNLLLATPRSTRARL